jgi:hypothetical protein
MRYIILAIALAALLGPAVAGCEREYRRADNQYYYSYDDPYYDFYAPGDRYEHRDFDRSHEGPEGHGMHEGGGMHGGDGHGGGHGR